jgi:quercetin dioxygenase-like cupin family protein
LPALGGQLQWKPVRHALGVDAFGVNAYHGASTGDLVVEEHEDPHQELYLVVRGRARFRAGGDEFDAPAGSFVLFEPGEHRVGYAAEPDTVVVAVGAEAERFEPSAWEYAFRSKGLLDLGRSEEARAAAAEGLELYPSRPDLLYALACIEAKAGNKAAALERLGEAATQHREVLDWAREEPLFAGIPVQEASPP